MSTINNNLRETHFSGDGTVGWFVNTDAFRGLESSGGIIVGVVTEADSRFCYIRESPDFGQFVATLSGSGEGWVDGKWQRFEPGTAYVAPPGPPHGYRTAPRHRWQLAWARFPARLFQTLATGVRVPRLCAIDAQCLRTSIEGLHRESIQHADFGVMQQWLGLIRTYCRRSLAGMTSEPSLDALWLAVSDDICRPWNVSELAAHLGMTGETLRRKCLAHYGVPPMRRVKLLKMRHAANLLLANVPVDVAAQRVGYDNAFAFSTAFKRIMGKPPTAYRRDSFSGRKAAR